MIKGEKIVLRAFEREDLPNCVRWFNDPEVVIYYGRFRPLSMAEEEEWYEEQLKDNNQFIFAIEFEGKHIGNCGFFDIDRPNRQAELIILIGEKDYWDKGLGTDAVNTLVRYGFEQMNFHRVYLKIFEPNGRAIRCYEKCGFVHEGLERESQFRHGRYMDLVVMSILEQEFKAGLQREGEG